jgi:hypothetical protein
LFSNSCRRPLDRCFIGSNELNKMNIETISAEFLRSLLAFYFIPGGKNGDMAQCCNVFYNL